MLSEFRSRLQGDYQGAIADYNRAIEIDPNYVAAYNNRGLAYDDLEEYQRAIADYNRAIKLDPNYAHAYYNRGNVYRHLEQDQRAIADYQQAAELYQQQGNEADYQDALNQINLDFHVKKCP